MTLVLTTWEIVALLVAIAAIILTVACIVDDKGWERGAQASAAALFATIATALIMWVL